MIKGINHIGISVANLTRSIEFYRDLLGLQVVIQTTFEGETYAKILGLEGARGKVALLRLGDLQIELFEFLHPSPKAGNPTRPVCDQGITHFCMEVDDIEGVHERLAVAGVRFHCPPLDFSGIAKATYGRDPDGNVFELWERQKGEQTRRKPEGGLNNMSSDWITKSQGLRLQVRNFVDGRWADMEGDPALEKLSPRDGRVLCRFGTGTIRETQEAVVRARRAFEDGRWSRVPVQRRKDILHKLASLIDKHREELALLECLDVGKPINDALSFDVPTAAATIRFHAEAADKFYGKVYAVDRSSLSYELCRPLGVVAGIVGWNFPLLLAATKIGPALATGNSLIVKPSELTSFATARIAELAIEAGVPEGVFNVIHGGANVGAALAAHPNVDLVTFTGSTHTGKKLLMAAGQSNMKRLILECGGKAPNIVFDDCPNLDAVADAVVARAFWNQGQVCTASSRLLVQRSIKDELLPLVIEKTTAFIPGDPLRVETKLGAVVSQGHKNKIREYWGIGESEGAKVVYRSNSPPPHEGGFYVTPTIFDHVSSGHRIAQEEIFGAVLAVISFQDEDEAIQIANNTLYGLSSILWTKNMGRAHRVTQSIKAGWVVVNGTDKPVGGPGVGVLTIGGQKESGLGAEGGIAGLKEYTNSTAVQMFV